jgi:thymidylate synthase (FAD)
MNQIKVELQEWMGSDRQIAEAAWTSSLTLESKDTRTQEDIARVVQMLIKDKHASPIEAVVFRFWIKMPISTDRQHMTHRIASHNGMSGRYRTMPAEFQVVPDDVKDIINKFPANSLCNWVDEYQAICRSSNDWYQNVAAAARPLISTEHITNTEFKRLREFFRGVLPQNNITERTTIMNLRSFANYQKLRNSEHAQPEIKQVAELMLKAVIEANVCPVAIAALQTNGWNI